MRCWASHVPTLVASIASTDLAPTYHATPIQHTRSCRAAIQDSTQDTTEDTTADRGGRESPRRPRRTATYLVVLIQDDHLVDDMIGIHPDPVGACIHNQPPHIAVPMSAHRA